jgi:hypothetical protein
MLTRRMNVSLWVTSCQTAFLSLKKNVLSLSAFLSHFRLDYFCLPVSDLLLVVSFVSCETDKIASKNCTGLLHVYFSLYFSPSIFVTNILKGDNTFIYCIHMIITIVCC